MKKPKEKRKQFDCYGDSLANLIKSLKDEGYTEKDFKNSEFELDYDCCYYESDTPSIKLVIK